MTKETLTNLRTLGVAILVLIVMTMFSLYFNGKQILEEGNKAKIGETKGKLVDITPATLNSMIQLRPSNPFFLLNADEKTPNEFINGTSAFLPYDTLIENQVMLPTQKGIRIVVYSRDGKMSQIAAQKLLLLGYQSVFNLKGGTDAWIKIGLPIEHPQQLNPDIDASAQ